MNNTISVEITHAVVAEKNVKNTDESDGSARSDVKSGKKLPVVADAYTAQPSKNTAETRMQSTARVEKAVQQLNDYAASLQRDLRFTMDEDLGQPIVHVVDRQTQQVIRQIPNETTLRLARNLKDIELQRLQAPNKGAEGSLGLINTRI